MIYRYKYYIILILVSIIILLKIQSNSINKNPLLKINNNPIQFSQIKNGHIDYATEYTLSITDSILHEIISIKKNNQTIENTLLKLDYITFTFQPTNPRKTIIIKTEKKQLKRGINTHNIFLKTNQSVKTINIKTPAPNTIISFLI